ncbi:TauD/TfdA family dioxygenase [Altererythrobacter xixiisoli]|uniref:TauD/TfdA family dioxygenase n=1 Tax=Croceibacterium xixiisoli TaxID=1476466 RepID=A0A6I4TZY8_9SPHN|nr:TauD/TfdA family dioxygenase [Croceibacterium xixiisoli]MXP00660.1 TauD/TfdA family dioxygenase [Croceibacterium xixiisoli]
MSLTVQPILPRFGAEVSGIDITRPLDEEQRQAVIAAMNRWGVCVYRNTGLDDASHVAFSRNFGHLEKSPMRPGRNRLEHRELFDASNLDVDGNITRDPVAITYRKGDRLWHTDSAFMEKRTSYSLLLAHQVPKEAGETWFADTRSAWEDLPQSMKDKVRNLKGINSLWWSRRKAGAEVSEEQLASGLKAVHPLVHVHRGSGREALFIAAHTMGIEGMPDDEARALIDELIAFTTQPEYTFKVKYAPGDLVIWDNLCSMHRGGEFDAANEARDMRRTTVREGTEPYAVESDDPFTELFSTSVPTTFNTLAANA